MISFLQSLPEELAVIISAALPISELRGAIPLGLYLGLPLYKTVFLAILGNLIPVVPILFLLNPVSERLRRFSIFKKFFDWLFERTRKKGDLIQRYEALGLILFVAVPLPITGAWTGCVAASLFKIKFRYAFPAITAGIIIASIIVSILAQLGIFAINHF